jgi:UDP-N-acetylmuramyl tripeptide synthase
VTDLTQAKAVVAKALDGSSDLNVKTLSLNADDENLIAISKTLNTEFCWFSLDEYNPVISHHRQAGGAVCFVRNGQLIYVNKAGVESCIIAINDIPMTLKGAAVHNIHNALGAICLAKSLNIAEEAIHKALNQFSSNADDNPGRGNQFEIKGAHLILDYAHNAHSTLAMATTLKNMPAKRKFLMISHPGDRSNADIIKSTNIALSMKPDFIIIADIAEYLRGREIGEVPKLIAETVREANISDENIFIVDSPYQGVKLIAEKLETGDLALLMALADRSKIIEYLNAQS